MNGTVNYYYPKTIKMIHNAVIGMFSNIIIYKFDKMGNPIKEIQVPVQFGQQTRMQKALNDLERRKFYTQLPRINVNFNGLSIAADRVMSPHNERFFSEEDVEFELKDDKGEIIRSLNGLFSDYTPVPYDFSFTITVICSSLSESSQILENILPYFAPKNSTVRVREFEFLNMERDLITSIGGIETEFNAPQNASEPRIINVNFDFNVQGFIYRPVTGSELIETALVNIFHYKSDGSSGEALGGVIIEGELDSSSCSTSAGGDGNNVITSQIGYTPLVVNAGQWVFSTWEENLINNGITVIPSQV